MNGDGWEGKTLCAAAVDGVSATWVGKACGWCSGERRRTLLAKAWIRQGRHCTYLLVY